MAAYRKLVYETPGFTDYFFAATPIREIAELNIGSRPASRKATRDIADLRAIPWGFSWGQSRVALPGLVRLRLGDRGVSRQRPRRAQAAPRAAEADARASGRFFARCCRISTWCSRRRDLAIAARYAELVEDRKLGRRIFARDRGRMAAHQRCAVGDHRREAAPRVAIRRSRARSSIAFRISIRSITCRSS